MESRNIKDQPFNRFRANYSILLVLTILRKSICDVNIIINIEHSSSVKMVPAILLPVGLVGPTSSHLGVAQFKHRVFALAQGRRRDKCRQPSMKPKHNSSQFRPMSRSPITN